MFSPRLGAGTALRARLMCTGSQESYSRPNAAQQMWSWARQNNGVVLVVGGMTLVMYGFYRGSVRIMKFFFNVSDKQIFTLGFMAGMVAAAAIAGSGAVAARRLSSFHVDDVYRAGVKELRKHAQVSECLGGSWQPGAFRGYAVESLRDAVQGSERRARSNFWEAPARRVQMIFVVKGPERDGMVSLEAHKRGGEYHFEMLSLDMNESRTMPAEHLFLAGKDDHALFDEVADLLGASRAAAQKKR